jgi:hypothetical protein
MCFNTSVILFARILQKTYLHVSARILANGSLLLPPVPICSLEFACALASGRYSSLARRRTVAALLLWQFCRAGSAGAGK